MKTGQEDLPDGRFGQEPEHQFQGVPGVATDPSTFALSTPFTRKNKCLCKVEMPICKLVLPRLVYTGIY